MSKVKNSAKDAEWAEAKKKCRLNNETIRMAKELGMSPKSLMKNIPSKTQQWKAPVHIWVRDLYEKRFGKRKANEGANKPEEPHQVEALHDTAPEPPPVMTWEEWQEIEALLAQDEGDEWTS